MLVAMPGTSGDWRWSIQPENNQRQMKAAKVPEKKLEQEEKMQVAKEAKQPRSPSSNPKRSKVKVVEGGKKKAAKKTDLLGVPLGWWKRFVQYLREVLHELRKVVFPSRKETLGSTTVVLVICLIAALFLGLVDSVLAKLVRLLVG
jgi:preprotein translocase subunit SecE